MGKIHIKGGSPLQLMFTDANGKSLEDVTLGPGIPDDRVPDDEHWYTVLHANGMIQANKRKKKDENGNYMQKGGSYVYASPHVFRAGGDMEVDFESTPEES